MRLERAAGREGQTYQTGDMPSIYIAKKRAAVAALL
jgi:hypothetical protein